MTYSVAVSGASGYAGGEILRILAAHPDVEIRTVTAHSNAGQPLIQHQPHLRSLAHLDAAADDARGARRSRHRVPRAAARPVRASSPTCSPTPPLVIDAGADHRLESIADWEQFYGGDFHDPWTYGVPELLVGGAQAARAARRRDAHRGPGLQRQHREPEPRAGRRGRGHRSLRHRLRARGRPVRCRQEPEDQPAGERDPRQRQPVRRRRHAPAHPRDPPGARRGIGSPGRSGELASEPVDDIRISFTPVLVPMSRGILATSTAPIAHGATDAEHPRRLGGRLRRRDLRAAAARGAVPADRRRARSEHRPDRPRDRRARRTGSWSSPPSTTSSRAQPARRSSP